MQESRGKPLVFLAYVSRMLCDPAEVAEILRVSRLRNGQTGLTGLLLHDQRHFFQIIEGEVVAVGATLLRIADDPRHRDVRILASRRVDFRLFSNWRMRDAEFRDGRATIASTLADIETLPPAARAEAIQGVALEYGG
jgi:hypothetical protein